MTNFEDKPDTTSGGPQAFPLLKPLVGTVLILMMIFIIVMTQKKDARQELERASSSAETLQNTPHAGSSAAELVPVITGGAGSHKSLGGNSSLGGGAHH